MPDVQNCVQRLLDNLVARDIERGLQVAVYRHGELVVDAWAGSADAATGRPADGDTLFHVMSTGKAIVATVIHLLAERGKLDYGLPIAEYWPEFAANGKERITVRHALTHAAGLPQSPDGIGLEEMCDWGQTCRAIANPAPLWEPGTTTYYHAFTFGWILGELARRVDGRPFPRIVQEEVCRPLGITSLYFGIPDEVEPRVAEAEGGELGAFPPSDPLAPLAQPPFVWPRSQYVNRPSIRRACIPAAGMITNARSIARHYAALSGTLPGIQLISSERLRIATEPQIPLALFPGDVKRQGLGYWLSGEGMEAMGRRSSVFGHLGSGGSIGFADPEFGLSFGVAKNRLLRGVAAGESAWELAAHEVRDALGIPD